MISILFAFISFSFSQCPSYDDVTIIKDGCDDESLYKKQNIYSCGNTFKKNLETTDCRLLIYDCTFTISRDTLDGGAMKLVFNDNSDVGQENIIENCKFIGCFASNGGCLYLNGNKYGTPFRFNNCLFQNNEVRYKGAVLYAESISLTIENCEFKNNTANNGLAVFYIYPNQPSSDYVVNLHVQNNYFDCLIYRKNTDSLIVLN